ncbi:MAG: 5'-nucleotidase C-terminal domain-containing protein [Mangrovibacterium sp.]
MNKVHLLIVGMALLSACKSNHVMSSLQGETLNNDAYHAYVDSNLVRFVEPYNEEMEKAMSGVVIVADKAMVADHPESELTNCLTDMFLENMRQIGARLPESPYPQVGYINFYSLRSSFPAGDIKLRNIYEMLPFENQVVYLQITGANMLKFAEITALRGGDAVSGMRLTITPDNKVGTFEINGQAFDKNKNYWIVTSDYVANGGDNMTMFSNPLQRVESGLKIRDTFIDYMRAEHEAGRKLSGKLDGRIFYE